MPEFPVGRTRRIVAASLDWCEHSVKTLGTHRAKCLTSGSFSITLTDSKYILCPVSFYATQVSCFSSQLLLRKAPELLGHPPQGPVGGPRGARWGRGGLVAPEPADQETWACTREAFSHQGSGWHIPVPVSRLTSKSSQLGPVTPRLPQTEAAVCPLVPHGEGSAAGTSWPCSYGQHPEFVPCPKGDVWSHCDPKATESKNFRGSYFPP